MPFPDSCLLFYVLFLFLNYFVYSVFIFCFSYCIFSGERMCVAQVVCREPIIFPYLFVSKSTYLSSGSLTLLLKGTGRKRICVGYWCR